MTFKVCPRCGHASLHPTQLKNRYCCEECNADWEIVEKSTPPREIDQQPMPLFDRRCRRKSDKGVSQ